MTWLAKDDMDVLAALTLEAEEDADTDAEVLQLQAAAAVHAPRDTHHGRNVMLPPPAVRWSNSMPIPTTTTDVAALDGGVDEAEEEEEAAVEEEEVEEEEEEEEEEAREELNVGEDDSVGGGYADAEREAVQAAPAGVAEEDSYDDDEFEEYHPEEDGEVTEAEPGRYCLTRRGMPFNSINEGSNACRRRDGQYLPGPKDIACHVIGCHLTRKRRFKCASTMCRAISARPCPEVLELALQTLKPLSQSHASDAFSDVFGSIASEDISFTDISTEFPGGFGGGEGDSDDLRRSSQYQVVDAVDNHQAEGVLNTSTRPTLNRLIESACLLNRLTESACMLNRLTESACLFEHSR